MNALAHAIAPISAMPAAVISNDFGDLAHIFDNEVYLCLIHRQPETQIQSFVAELLRRPEEIEIAEAIDFEHFKSNSLLPDYNDLPGYRAWWHDVARIACAYCELFGIGRIGLRLRTLDKAMCPRFHVDHVPCRLVCTYGGVGTEWLPDECVDRTKLGLGAQGLPDELSGLILDGTAILTMPPYAVGLMKGSKWKGNEDHGAVHRSPKPQPEAPRRLLLTLDML
jgi:hypothetical protein